MDLSISSIEFIKHVVVKEFMINDVVVSSVM